VRGAAANASARTSRAGDPFAPEKNSAKAWAASASTQAKASAEPPREFLDRERNDERGTLNDELKEIDLSVH
jgi:hypothetical protein